jgi:hypothetical protein
VRADHEPLVVTIYIIERGWHTDIALPATAVTGPLAVMKQRFSTDALVDDGAPLAAPSRERGAYPPP